MKNLFYTLLLLPALLFGQSNTIDSEWVAATTVELTIATGAVDVSTNNGTHFSIDTESDAASDDLITITQSSRSHTQIRITNNNSARAVVIKDGDGNINTGDGQDYTLGTANSDWVDLFYDGATWNVVGLSPSLIQPSVSFGANDTITAGEAVNATDYRLNAWPTANNRGYRSLTANATLVSDSSSDPLGKRHLFVDPDADGRTVQLPLSGDDKRIFFNVSDTYDFDVLGTAAANLGTVEPLTWAVADFVQDDGGSDYWVLNVIQEADVPLKNSSGEIYADIDLDDTLDQGELLTNTAVVVQLLVFDDSEDTATGDGAGDIFWRVPSTLNGYNITAVAAQVQTAGTTGTTDIQIANVTDTVDVLSTKITIDSAETDSSTAATAAVINTSNDDVATGDSFRIDVDAVSTTAAKGLLVEIQLDKP